MASLNETKLIGYLGADPEVKRLPSGEQVARISVATTEHWTDKGSQERKSRTEWHRVVFFGKLADIVGKYLTKGSQVYVCGSLRTHKWEDDKGTTHYSTEINGNEMQMLDRRENETSPGDDHEH